MIVIKSSIYVPTISTIQMKENRDTETSVKPSEIIDLVSQEVARHILATATQRECTAEELAEECDVSVPTIYRHVNELQEHGFLDESLRIEQSGNHRKAFETTLERVCLTFADGLVSADIHIRKDFIDKFSEFWQDLEFSRVELRS
jgi:DNA-binding transcriptional ArsR family regulator